MLIIMITKNMSPITFLFLVTIVTILKADVSDFFDNNLTIEAPVGTLFPGEKAQFACIAKNFHRQGQLIWHWHFPNRSTFYIIDPESDQFDMSNEFVRRSIILIPESTSSNTIAYIGCELSIKDHSQDHSQKLVPVQILDTPQPSRNKNKQHSPIVYPQIAIELYGSPIRNPSMDNLKSYRHPPHIVTNQTINLSQDVKSMKLSCIIPKHDVGKYEWVISSSSNDGTMTMDASKKQANPPSTSLILNKLALIYREAIIAGRLPPSPSYNDTNNCTGNPHRRPFPCHENITSEELEVIISPIIPTSNMLTHTYTCQHKNLHNHNSASAYVSVTILATRAASTSASSVAVDQRDQDLLNLINILMQILQSSSGDPGSSDGSGSGPLYGVGFGSSTIMILMALTIVYLKRQLNQIQEQVKEGEYRKKLKNRSNDTHSSEL